MLIRATMENYDSLCDLYRRVADRMEEGGNEQWHWSTYPNAEVIAASIAAGDLYILRDDPAGDMLGAVTVNSTFDPEYGEVHWMFGVKPGAFHRLAVDPALQGRGLGRRLIGEVCDLLRSQGCDALRIDTYDHNVGANALYRKLFREAGDIHLAAHPDTPDVYHCYERRLTEDCPLLPVPMHPSYRHGSMTPWGGDRLHEQWGKTDAPACTGESLECSCLPGLESRDPMGVTLPALVGTYGAAFAGRYAQGTFPLLLKLLDAAEALSVQIHPNDEYAGIHEGKLGKTEAWLILQADPDSELIYGIKPGTTVEELEEACRQGSAVSGLLRRVPVKAGDVCFIPAGCVHAILGGLTIYEIQQSSDVTYRFYDWDRVDAQGKSRPLHIRQALDVTDLSFSLNPAPTPSVPVHRAVDCDCFTLDILQPDGSLAVPQVQDFGFLTALTEGMTLCWQGAEMKLPKGCSVYIPAAAPELTICGQGMAALSMPR